MPPFFNSLWDIEILMALSILNVNKSVVAVVTSTFDEPPVPPWALKYANVAPTTKVINVTTATILRINACFLFFP